MLDQGYEVDYNATIEALAAIATRLDESPSADERSNLITAQTVLEARRQEFVDRSYAAAAGRLANAAATLQAVIEKASSLPVDAYLLKLNSAIKNLAGSDPPLAPPSSKGDGNIAPSIPPADAHGADALDSLAGLPGDFISRLVSNATSEWRFFGMQLYDLNGSATHVGHKEAEATFAERIGRYWLEGTNTRGIDGTSSVPWSAAFISWVMKTSGAGDHFRYSTQHSVYISQSIRDHLAGHSSASFWGWQLNERRPQVGDLICWARQDGIDFQHQNGGDYKGHSDIIVEIDKGCIWVIGGNVGNSVTKRPIPLENSGFVKQQTIGGELLFAVMQTRVAPLASQDQDIIQQGAPVSPVEDVIVSTADAIAWGKAVSAQFRERVVNISGELRCDPSQLMAVMAFESGETFSASVKNSKSGATGLIQFMPQTAVSLGTTTDQLAAMTAVQQLDYVRLYLLPRKGKLRGLSDLYMAILWPAAVGKPDSTPLFVSSSPAYNQNQGLDVNADGVITKGEAASKVQSTLDKGLSTKWIG